MKVELLDYTGSGQSDPAQYAQDIVLRAIGSRYVGKPGKPADIEMRNIISDRRFILRLIDYTALICSSSDDVLKVSLRYSNICFPIHGQKGKKEKTVIAKMSLSTLCAPEWVYDSATYQALISEIQRVHPWTKLAFQTQKNAA